MDYVIAMIASAVAGAFLTAIACRTIQIRRQRARWSFAFVGAFAAGIFTVVAVDRWELFHLGDLVSGKCPVWVLVLMDFMLSVVAALVLTTLVVHHYRTKFSKDKVTPHE